MDQGVIWIFAIIITIIGIAIACKKGKEEGAKRIRSTKLFSFQQADVTRSTGSIIVYKRDSEFRDSFTIEAHHNYAFSVVPDKQIFTSVSVGGITTGGVSTIKGGLQGTDLGKTGTYWINYKYGEMLGSKWSPAGINSFILPSDLFEMAKKDVVLSKYVVTEEQLRTKKLDYYKDNSLIVNEMTSSDCNYLLNWLSNK